MEKARMVSAFTLVNKISENQLLIKCRRDKFKQTKCAPSSIPWEQTFLCYTHAPSAAKVLGMQQASLESCQRFSTVV